MFEQIVRAASREDVPQYFVITPKVPAGAGPGRVPPRAALQPVLAGVPA
jgi:hypothetical protein